MKKANLLKKIQACVLTLSLLFSIAGPFASLTVFAESNEYQTATDGQIVAGNYAISNAEKALLSSGLLVGKTHAYYVPDADDGLIFVDTENKKITVIDYEGNDGYIWRPVSVDIVVGTEVKETVSITNNEGYYNFDGNAFSVVAEYALDVEVNADTQKALLNAPGYLVDGLANINKINSIKDNLGYTEEAMDILVKLATTGYTFEIYGSSVPYVKFEGNKTRASAIALEKETLKNGGKLDLTVMLEEYAAAESKVQYLIENGAALKAKAEETKQHIANISNDSVWGLIKLATNKDEIKVLLVFRDSLDDTTAAIEAATANEWKALTETFLKAGLTKDAYVLLDALVGAIDEVTDVSGIEIKNPLRVATTKIQHNMSMFDVKVNVVLNLTDPTSEEIKYYEAASKSATLTLAEGATKGEILAAVEEAGIVASAKAQWGSKFVNGKFHATTSALPNELTSDIEYVITYDPNTYDVTFDLGGSGDGDVYPYGYVLKLEKHPDELKAYDYTINGSYYAQGSTYTVVDTTHIVRKEGKSYKFSSIYQIVADNYLNADGKDILTSGALFNDVAVNVRYPDNNNGIVSLSANVLTAADYSASYKDLFWKPYSCTLSNGNTYFFGGQNSIEIPESFDNVTVNYRLYLSNFDEQEILEIANIAATLCEEAEAQLEALDRISAQEGNLETLNRTMVGILAGLIEETTLSNDAAKNKLLQDNFTSVLEAIKSECMGSTNLYLFDIVKEYTSATDKLLHYYVNNDEIRSEIDKLAGYMTKMLGDDAKLSADDKYAALETLIRSLPSNIVSPDKVDEYVSKLTSLETIMNSVKNDLSAPNALINLDSNELGALTAAILGAEGVYSFATLPDLVHLEDSSISVTPSNKTAVTVTIEVEGGKSATVVSDVVFVDEYIDAGFVNSLKASIAAKLAELSVNGKYYNTTYTDDAFDAIIGKLAGSLGTTEYEFVWTYKTFTVSVPGTSDQSVSYNKRVISLPASLDPAYRYDYYVNGTKVSGTTYNLTLADLDKVIDGSFTVTKESVNVVREDLVKYVNSLNEAVAGGAAVFALVEDVRGNYSIVLKIDAAQPTALTGAIQGMAIGMVQGAYPYVGIDNNGFLSDGSIYLQSLIDAFANSGFGSDALLNIVDANGNINHMTLSGNVVSNAPVDKLGGKLMATTIELGLTAQDAQSLPFYVTLGSVNDDFVSVRNLFAGKFGSFMTITCANGSFGIKLNLPQKMYEAFLAALLITENITLDDINAVNGEIAVSFVNNLLKTLITGDVTVETFDNTLKQFGLDLDLSSQKGAESLFSTLKSFYGDLTFVYDELGATTSSHISISSLIDSMNVGVLGNIIAEKETGLNVNLSATIEDLGTDFEAIYVDVDAAGITNKVGLVADLESKLEEISGNAAIVLLKDVEGDLVFKATSILNLNGFTVKGDLNAIGKTIVIDSNLDDAKVGTIEGSVTGNPIIVGGKYSQDVSSYLKNGFVQKANGVVSNKYYSISKNIDNEVIVTLNASEIVALDEKPDVAALAIDLACDLLFNGYSSNYLALDGKTIYNITLNDIVGIYASSNRLDCIINEALHLFDSEALSAFVTTVIGDVTDFTAISKALENSEPILEYSMVTKPWAVEFAHVANGDYITSNIVSGEKTNNSKIKILVEADDAHRDYLVDLFAELGKTVSTDFEIFVSHQKVDNNINITASLDASVIIDWTNPDYAVMFSVIAANGLSSTARANLVAGIRAYYETGDISALSLAFNSLTTAQLIEAVKAVSKDASFTKMISSLGLADVVDADVIKLESLFDKFGKVAAYVVRRADIVGGGRTLASFLDSDDCYGISRGNIDKLFTKDLFRGYVVNVDATLKNATFKIKLFGDPVTSIDFAELNRQIAIAQGLNKDDYTAESWAVLENALADAIAALEATTQAEVDAAAKALADAIAALEEKPVVPEVDYTELNSLIAQAQGLNKDDYTAESWAVLEDALADAIEALEATTQAEVDAAAKALADAIAALEEKPVVPPVDYSALEEQIGIAQGLNKDDYTAESWAVLEEALANALAALNATTQAEVDAAAKALKDAISGLKDKPVVPEVDYTELLAQIAIAEGLNKDEYTEQTWMALEEALAKAIAAKNATTQAEVDTATKALKDAIAALEKKPVVPEVDYTELLAQIAIAEGLNKDDYTTETWAALEEALAKAIAAKNATTQAEVDTATKALKDAIAGLEKKPVVPEVDYTELLAQIAIAEGLNKDEYTTETWAALEEALAKAIAAKSATTQAEVDTATKALKDAIAGLEKKPVVPEVDYTELLAQIAIAEGLNKDDYTTETWAALEEALAKAIAAKNATTQAEVDTATKALKDAIAALELKAPEFVDSIGGVTLENSDKVMAYLADSNKNMLHLDADVYGITVDTLRSLLKFNALNADSIEITIGDGTLAGDALVANGTKVKAIARRNGTDEIDEIELTIIVQGDTNANGRVDVGDATFISQMLVGEREFTEIEHLAADTNCNGRSDIGDATRIAGKIVDTDNYESMIGKQ